MAEKGNSNSEYVRGMGEKIVKYLWWAGLKKAATSMENRLPKPKQLLTEFQKGLAEISSLHKVLGGNPLSPFYAEDSELNSKSYDSKLSHKEAVLNFFFDHETPDDKEDQIVPLLPQEGRKYSHKTPNESWFFLNGIGTNEDMARVNARMISDIFKRPVTALHNPTNGFIHDLVEVLNGRGSCRKTEIAHSAKEQIWQQLLKIKANMKDAGSVGRKECKVVVIAHSQGGIIMSNVIGMLLDEHPGDPLLDQLEVYTFASAHTEFPSPWHQDRTKYDVPFCEHFANDEDFVARIGVINGGSKKTTGQIYLKEGAGHLLNCHYLRDFAKGRYGKDSRLYSLCNGKRLSD